MVAQRLQWMDFVRGICIFLVVMVHGAGVVENNGLTLPSALVFFNDFMNPFRIPLLMFLSGMLLHKGLRKPAGQYFFGKFALIFWPFLVWSMVVYAAEQRLTLEWILKTPLTAPSLMWFLWFIAAYYVLAYLLLQRLKLPILPIIALCMLGAELLPDIVRMPRFSYLFGFFLLGHYIVDRGLSLHNRWGTIAGLVGLAAAFLGGYLNTQDIGGKYSVFYVWIPLGMVAFILWASQAYRSTKMAQQVEYIGRFSLVFYVAHFPIEVVMGRELTALGMTNGIVLYGLMLAAVLAISVLLQTLRGRSTAVEALFNFRAVQQLVSRFRGSTKTDTDPQGTAPKDGSPRTMRRLLVLLILLLPISALGGMLFALTSSLPQTVYAKARVEIRTTLGLEKNWFPVPNVKQAEGHQSRDCPDPGAAIVLVTGGQSNAANALSADPYVAQGDVAVWFDGSCYVAADPILGASGKRASLWAAMADEVAQQSGRPVLLINGAIGGTQFADWLDDRSGYFPALQTRLETAQAAGFTPDLVLWHQGETDAAVLREDLPTLRRDLENLLTRLQQNAAQAAPIYLMQASRCMGGARVNGFPKVIDMMRLAAQDMDGVIVGMNTDALGRDFRWDTCHFNSRGRAAIVAQIVPDVLQIVLPELSN